jgi:hypothetical protein
MVFPSSVHIRWLHKSKLRSVQHDDAQIIIRMDVSNVVRWQPRWGSVWGKCNLQIRRKVVHPSIERRIQLHKIWIDTPFLLFLDPCIDIIHSPNVTDNSGEISEVPRDVEFRVVDSGRWSWDTQIQRIYIDRQIRPSYCLSVEPLNSLRKTNLVEIQSSTRK